MHPTIHPTACSQPPAASLHPHAHRRFTPLLPSPSPIKPGNLATEKDTEDRNCKRNEADSSVVCICKPGHGTFQGITCAKCPGGSWSPGGNFTGWDLTPGCRPCPWDFTNNDTGLSSEDACYTGAGTGGLAAGEATREATQGVQASSSHRHDPGKGGPLSPISTR